MEKTVFWSLLITLIVLIAFLTYSLNAKAIDLGVYGETAQIKEVDLQEHIINKLKSLDQEKLQEYQDSIANQTVQNIRRPKPVKGVTKVNMYSQRYFDPTFTVNEDIYTSPGTLLYAKGTKLNPLEYKSFDEVWILIDGDDIAQVQFAKKYNSQKSRIKKIILVNGQPGEQEDGSFLYFDQAGEISKKLNITKVPSVISQTNGRNDILIEEIEIDKNGAAKNDKEP